MTTLSDQDLLKQSVAAAAVDYLLPKLHNQAILGIGTGSTSNFFIDLLAPHKHLFHGTVASSEASARRLAGHGIRVFDLNEVDKLDFYTDGADESNAKLQLIKGGGGALTREKIVTACSDCFICIIDQSKWVDVLGTFPLPVEVIPMARAYVERELKKLGGEPRLREGVTTDNGNCILDVHNLRITAPEQMENAITQIPGVVCNGLFALRPADVLLIAGKTGVRTVTR